MKFDPRLFLQIPDDPEEITRLRVSTRPEHANKAFRWGAGRGAESLKAHGRLDVVTENGLTGLDVSREHRIDSFAQKSHAEGGILRNATLHQLFETLRWHSRLHH